VGFRLGHQRDDIGNLVHFSVHLYNQGFRFTVHLDYISTQGVIGIMILVERCGFYGTIGYSIVALGYSGLPWYMVMFFSVFSFAFPPAGLIVRSSLYLAGNSEQ
jgi:hypothetical protein